ncbi:hypothetical protein HJC23_005309 [Cyclotella cryptica]|uniref:Aldehyde dehydrogenase domain-containing protein n=1 Tax=Cyclotella cryptica TaxID=29204 RepID=A0ABD3PGB1_9STRA|eukprot:CCRYP_015075-RA/>CCRYP_015075-RA protein AED:0.28 eAED:0.28 QI:38/1/1/1/1/1/3/674/500
MVKLKLLRPFIQGKTFRNPAGSRATAAPTRPFILLNPANATPHANYHPTQSAELMHALTSSVAAQKEWACTSPSHRSSILRRAADILSQNIKALSEIETMDTGRPVRETECDVQEGIECLNYYAGLIATAPHGEMQRFHRGNWGYTTRQPLGVCLGIGAWNYPLQGVLWKSVPALAFGNSMIFKPSEYTPSTALWLGECFVEAGVPEGLFQVVLGAKEVAEQLIQSPQVSKVSFTGSVATGQKVYEMASRGMKKVTMELGGKSPMIIFDDANMDNAVSAAMMGNWYSSGQVCSNATRVFVHESIVEEFVEKLVERTKKLRIGDPMSAETDIGPMAHKQQMDKVLEYIDIGIKEGSTLIYGGKRPSNLPNHLKDGYFLEPAIFTNCTDDMTIVQHEIFGMVMSILTFRTEDEVIERANKTEFGLAAGVFTRDIQRGHRVIDKLDAGVTWVNNYNLAPVQMPWGGCKRSGIGRENGSASVEEWTQWKAVYVGMGTVDCPYPK